MVSNFQSDPLLNMMFKTNPDTGLPTSQQAQSLAPDIMLNSLFPQEPAEAPPPAPAEPGIISEFTGGAGAGVQQLISSGQGLGSVSADVLGFEDTAQEWARLAAQTEEESFREYPRAIERFEDISSPGEFALWTARTLGEQVPIVASVLAGGGIGGLLGRAVGKGALSLAQAELALARAGQIGAGLGAVATATGIETGATGNELYQATGDINPRAAFTAGIIKGSLEAIVPAFLGARLGITPDLSGGLVNSIIKTFDRIVPTRVATAVSVGLGETITETLQETVDVATRSFVDANYDALGPEAASRLLNAAAGGGIVGLFFGGLAGGPSRQQQQPRPTTQEDVDAETVDPGAFSYREALRAETAITSGTVFELSSRPQIEGLPTGPTVEETTAAAGDAPTQIPEEYLSGKVAVLPTGDSFAQLQYPVFRNPEETLFEAGNAPTRGGATVRLDVRNLTEEDISAELRALPETLSVTDPRVRLLDPLQADEALEFAQMATDSRGAGIASLLANDGFTFGPGTGYVLNAEQLYESAIKRGFRYVPEETDGFVLARTPKLEEIQVESSTEILPNPFSNEDYTYTIPFGPGRFAWHTETDGFTPLTRRARKMVTDEAQLVSDQGYGESKAVFLDKRRLAKKNLVEFEPLWFHSSPLSTDLRMGRISNADQLAKVLAKNTEGITVAPGSDMLRIFNHLETSVKNYSDGFENLAAQDYAKAIKAGLRPPVVDDTKSVIFVGSQSELQDAIVMEVPGAPILHRRTPSKTWYSAGDPGEVQVSNAAKQLKYRNALNKRAYHIEQHELGTAVLVDSEGHRLTTAEKNALKPILKLYNAWMKRFGIKTRLIVHGRDLGKQYSWQTIAGEFAGHLAPISPETQSLAISMKRLMVDNVQGSGQTLAPWANVTAIHEFGHFIAFTELLKAPQGTRDRIVSAYNRALVKGALGGRSGFLQTFAAPAREGYAFDNTTFEDGRLSDPTEFNYWLNFDEWFANQVARYVVTFEQETIDPLERLFKAIARKIRSAYFDMFKARGKQWHPEVEVKDFLDAMREKTATKEQLLAEGQITENEAADLSPLVSGMEMGETESRLDNFETLKGSLPYADPFKAPPGGPLSARVRELFNRYGMRDRRFDETAADLDYFNTVVKYGFNVFQLADKNKHIPQLQRYKELIDQWWVYKMRIISRADERTREWRTVSREQGDALAKFLFAMDQMEYLTKKERDSGVSRWPTDAELTSLVKKYNLQPETFVLYEKIRDDFTFILDEIEETAILDLKRTAADSIQIDLETVEIQKEFGALRERPYFPHSRFGDYAVVVKTKGTAGKPATTAYMEQFKTERSAKDNAVSLRKRYPRGQYNIAVRAIPKSAQPFRGLPPSLLKAIRNRLNLTDEQKIWLDQMLVEYLPSQSFRKRLLKREDIPGYSLDAMRSYANYFFHGANYFARIRYFDVLQDQINDLKESTSALSQGLVNVTKRDRIREFLQDHFSYIMNPGRDWAQLRSLAFQWWLGFSVASAAVNFTQIPLVAWPYLSARFGDFKAMNAVRRATFAWQNVYKGKTKGVSDEEFAAIERGIREGFLDESQATELANVSEGGNLQRLLPGTKAQRLLMQSANWSAFFFQTSEKINRRITFRAAYALAKANPDAEYLTELALTEKLEYQKLLAEGMSDLEVKAFLAGKDAVRRTQFEYAQHARPKFMQGKRGTILTFFMFTQNMLYFAAHSPGSQRYILLLLLAAGIMGFPGAEDLASIARLMARNLFGKDFDIDKELREFIVELTDGEISADLILHGVSRAGFGIPDAADKLGIPFPKVDLSPNIGMGQIIPGVSELGRPGLDFEERFSNVSTDIAGAAFGIGINLMKFLSDDSLPIDDMKRWERAMPRAMRNIVRSGRYLDEGRERTRTGATLVEFDASDPQQLSEIIAQGLGFTPTRVSRKWNRIGMQREAAAFWETRKGMLLAQYDHAFTVGGKEALVDIRKAVRRYNQEVPFAQLRITGKTLGDSRKERSRRRRLFERGIPQKRAERPLYRDIERLTPEVEEAVDVEDVTRLR